MEKEKSLTLNKDIIDVLVANVIPTTKYFESRFDNMENQVNDIRSNIKRLDTKIDKLEDRFDKRFEQIDSRFVQIDGKFVQLDLKIDKNAEENRKLTVKMFSFTFIFLVISVLTMFAKMFELI